ncbi:replication endonuclease [Colwellia polaris]|jgi:hypothetical protein|uniref:replication endonuclease n=1 Tax=Colwellia polaris TaxID=326537 RepID=UPI000A16DCFF|nr:replication endonuclease [Colwellia polaris]|tara:strand:- start:3482 stop:5215 length:1734 start_codon:yes stop_codon:yes gene_type:complete
MQNKDIETQLNKIAAIYQDDKFLSTEWHTCPADRRDVEFTFNCLNRLPDVLKKHVLDKANKLKTRYEKNTYIRTMTESLVSYLPEKLRLTLTVNEDEIRYIAIACAERCRRIALHHNVKGRSKSLTKSNEDSNSVNVTECNIPLTEISVTNTNDIYPLLTAYVESFGLKKISLTKKGVTELGAIKRMCDKRWWIPSLRKVFKQAYEQAAIKLGLVSKHAQIYASDLTVNNRKQQRARNDELLSSISVINDIGQQFTLKELSNLNVSNPEIRKAELMLRLRGFEDLSKSHDHVGIFITITCPSKYHAVFAKSGKPNPKYQDFTPYQANQYLCDVWAKVRAQWNRENIKPYGFRIAEPQHDGTPHWHLVLFVESGQVERVKGAISHYALQEDGDERGALENRCDFKLIDPKKGSATGYVAKYVSKNIDGKCLDKGVYGEDPITAAQRVDAWSSTWCIRQFQQIGGASVTVWRELRRLRKSLGIDSVLEKARIAADESKWDDYITAMGGVFCKRKDQPIKLAYDTSFDSETGECKLGFYDGNIIQSIKGVYFQGQMIVTRFFSWRLERANVVCSNLEFCK